MTSTDVLERRVFAMDDVKVAFRGEGFGVLSTYTCLLVSAGANYSAFGNTSMSDLTWKSNVSATTRPANTSTILCPPLRWPFGAQHVVPVLMRDASLVSGSLRLPFQIVEIIQHWTNVSPRQVSAHGAVITVRKCHHLHV